MHHDIIGREIRSYKYPFIVSILSFKGGVGKTTLAINIATKLHLDKNKVLLIDLDPQASAKDWNAAGTSEITVIGMDKFTSLEKDLKKISKDFEWVIMDGVPQLTDIGIAAIKCSDLIIIPITHSQFPFWQTDNLVTFIKGRRDITDGKPAAYFCATQIMPNTLAAKELPEALEQFGLPVMKGFTGQRIAYQKGISEGKTVFDTDDFKAIEEITNITNEIKEILL